MDVARLCSIDGAHTQGSHQRVSEYLQVVCSRYHGMGFSPRVEWVGEQTIAALELLLADTNCTDEERRAVSRFLELASQEIPGGLSPD